MTNPSTDASPIARGRVIAVLYLFVMTAGIIGQAVISDSLVVAGDAAKTAANILADTTLYRLAFTIFMLEMVAQVAVSVLHYDLLKPVDRSLARTATVIGVTGCGIKMFARVFFYAPLLLLGGAPYLSVIEPAQLKAMAYAALRIDSQGAAIALVFFGFEALIRGWLVLRSGFLPRFLGVMSMVGGLGWLTYLWPPLGNQAFMFVALWALAGVIAYSGWLLVRGVDEAKWRAQAALSASSIWR